MFTWHSKFQKKSLEASFPISATSLSTVKFLEVVASVTAKPQSSASVYTGSFDNGEDQIAYIMPFTLDHLHQTADFQLLFTRIRQWLHGRYRFTASFLSNLLAQGYRNPNVVLNPFIEHVGGFTPSDHTLGSDKLENYSIRPGNILI